SQQVTNADLTGHAVEVQSLTVKAGKGVSLGSKENKLEQVYLDIAGGQDVGGILIGNGNTGDTDLRIAIKTGAVLADDITIHNYNNLAAGEHGNDIVVDGTLQTSGNITLINDESDIEVTGTNAVLGKDVSFNAAGSIYNEHSIVAENTATLKAAKNILNVGGEIRAAEKVTMNAGELLWNLASITSTNKDVELIAGQAVLNTTSNSAEKPEGAPANAAGVIKAENGNVAISATKLLADDVLGGVYNNATIIADGIVTINSNDDVYNTGSITATASDGIVDISADNNLSNKGNITAHQIRAGAGKELQQADGDIVAVAGNVIDGKGNTVAEGGVVRLLAGTNVKIDNGSVMANGGIINVEALQNNVYIDNGSVIANNGTINIKASQNIEQNYGFLGTVTGEVNLTAEQSIILTDGELTAKEASLTALNGYIKQNYDNTLESINGYDIKIIDALTLKAGNSGTGAVETAIDLGSKFNELKDVVLQATNGDIVVGSGRSATGDLSITVANEQIVNGNILFRNFANGEENDINLNGMLKATGNVTVINDEADILVDTNGTVEGNNVTLTAEKNIINNNDIKATEQAALLARKGYIENNDTIQAVNSVDMDALAGNVYNFAGITSTEGYVDILAGGDIINLGDNDADAIIAKDTVILHAGDAVINTAKITSLEGNVEITGANAVYNMLHNDTTNPATGSTKDGTIEAGGNVIIETKNTAADDFCGVYNSANIIADGNVLMTSKDDLRNIGTVDAKGQVVLLANNELYNSGNIKAEGLVDIDSKRDITNSGEINSNLYVDMDADGNINNSRSIYSSGHVAIDALGNLNNSGSITAVDQVELRAKQDLVNSN
ncbi:MAG: beta strand repeat-containing protein, partial [Phascolarctobacterium sp.]